MRFWQAHGLSGACALFTIKPSSSRHSTYDCPKCAGWGEKRKGLRKGERKKSLLPHYTKWPVLFPLVTATASFPQPPEEAWRAAAEHLWVGPPRPQVRGVAGAARIGRCRGCCSSWLVLASVPAACLALSCDCGLEDGPQCAPGASGLC